MFVVVLLLFVRLQDVRSWDKSSWSKGFLLHPRSRYTAILYIWRRASDHQLRFLGPPPDSPQKLVDCGVSVWKEQGCHLAAELAAPTPLQSFAPFTVTSRARGSECTYTHPKHHTTVGHCLFLFYRIIVLLNKPTDAKKCGERTGKETILAWESHVLLVVGGCRHRRRSSGPVAGTK